MFVYITEVMIFFFFFQAEDGIRDYKVTGVQTCALPIAQILEGLSADERTDIVQRMSPHERHRVVPKLKPEIRKELEGLLQYPPRTAGGIMTTEFVRLDPKMSVGDALKHIRSVAREKESIYACYVMEPTMGRLLGAVSLRDLVMAELEAPLTKVMRPRPVTVNALDDQEVV